MLFPCLAWPQVLTTRVGICQASHSYKKPGTTTPVTGFAFMIVLDRVMVGGCRWLGGSASSPKPSLLRPGILQGLTHSATKGNITLGGSSGVIGKIYGRCRVTSVRTLFKVLITHNKRCVNPHEPSRTVSRVPSMGPKSGDPII